MTGAEQGWGDEPSVLIFADREQDRVAAQEAAESVGARVIGSEPLSGALERLSRQVAVDAVFIEVDGSTTDGDRLIEWANHAAREQTAAPIISFPHALIDFVHARVEAPSVQMICGESIVERVSAFGTALAGRKHRLHDQGVEADAERLRRLSEEVARIAGALAELSSSARTAPLVAASAPRSPEGAGDIDAETVRALIRIRRLRDQFFSKDLFADPAWDMLLDLMAARLEKSRVAVSSLCIAAAVPATTALRWIRTLTEHGLFVRRHDPEDGRRIFIELSDGASEALTAYFRTAAQMGFRVG